MSQGLSRRMFMTRSAKLAAGGALAVSVAGMPGIVFADDERRRTFGDDALRDGFGFDDRDNRPPGQGDDDCDVLNYALTLEHLEANFYIQAINTFSESDIEDYIASQGFGPAVSDGAYQRVVDVRDHEVTHVNTLISVLQSLGCDPVPACTYDFSGALADVPTFLAFSQVLEDTGVKAYDGAIALIENPSLVTAAATIATVEARHASYFRLLNMLNPFPAAFDEAVAPQQILDAVLATGLIVSCPVAPPVPDAPQGC